MQTALNFLFILISIQLLQQAISSQEISFFLMATLGSMVLVNWIGSVWFKFNRYRWILPLLSIALLALLGKNDLFYGDYSLDFSDPKLIALLILSWLVAPISNGIAYFLDPFFKPRDKYLVSHTAQIIIIGFLIIFSTFWASWFGILLLAIGYFLYNSYSRTKKDSFVLSLVLLASAGFMFSLHNSTSIDLSIGKVLAGLLLGTGSYALGVLAFKSSSATVKFILLGLSIIVLLTVWFLENIHPAYGGLEAIFAGWIAVGLINFFLQQNKVVNVLFPIFILLGIITHKSENTPADVQEETTEIVAQEPSPHDTAGKDAQHLSGKYYIVSKSAQLSFQLGPKGGVVKGAIPEFEGTIDFQNDLKSAKFNVKLATKKLTTFNSLRDKTVLGNKYLNEPEFPTMIFSSNKLIKKEDGYLVEGKFTLHGKTNSQEIFIKYIGDKNGLPQFVGKGVVAHGQFGLPSSPQEGKGVEFTFEMELSR